MAQVDHIVDGIYRISTPPSVDGAPITFNQFLIDDEAPVLVHTGNYEEYEGIHKAISEVLDPATLAYVVLLHFEGDECGGMDRFMAEAKNAQLVGSDMSAVLNLTHFGVDYVDRVKGVCDGDVIDTGRHQLKFIETPHVHHWDSMMVFEESTKSLFPSDLYIQTGDQPPVVNEDLTAEMLRLLSRDRDLRPRRPRAAHDRPLGAARTRVDPRDARRHADRRNLPPLHPRAARGAVRLPGQVPGAPDPGPGPRAG